MIHKLFPNNKQKILYLGLFLIGVGLVCNEWLLTVLFSSDGLLSARNIVIIWAFDVTAIIIGLILAISRSYGTLLNFFVGVILTVLMLFGTEKLFYRLNHPPPEVGANISPAPRVWHEGSYTRDFFQPDDILGYTVRSNARVTSTKKSDDNIIYDVTYSIDEKSRRITPVDSTEQRDKFILFFGDSFTFGEGVQDNETLPYYVSKLAKQYRPYNYGLSGYGPQQTLAKLQSEDMPGEVNETEGIAIYTLIDAHVERAIGSMYVYNNWGDQMPYYYYDWSGRLVRKRNFSTGRPLLSTIYWGLGKSEIARYFNVNIPNKLTVSHYELTARIIAEARDSFRAKFHSDDFYVVVYPDEGDYIEDIIPHFERFKLKYLNYDERMKLDSNKGLSIAGDGHPTGKAHKIVAGWIAADLGIER